MRRWLPWLLIVAACGLVFQDWLLHPGRLPFSQASDLIRHYLPFKESLYRQFQAGSSLPAWDPLLLGGHPLRGDPGYGFFYPPALPFLIFPPARLFGGFFLFHVCLGGIFTWYWLGRFSLSQEARALGTLSYVLNLKLLGTLYAGFATMAPAQAWLPGVFLGCELLRGAPRETRRGMLLLGLAWGMQLLAGDAQLMLYGLLAGLGYLLIAPEATARAQGPISRFRLLALLLPALLLALLLSAPLLLPAARLTQASVRQGGLSLEVASLMSVPPAHLPAFFLPALSGWPGTQTWRGPGNFWEVAFYPGLLVWLLAGLALVRFPRDRRVLPLAFLSWCTLVFSFGRDGPLFPLLFWTVPGLDHFRGPARALPILALLLATLGALGLEQLCPARGEGAQATKPAGVADLPRGLVYACLAGGLALGVLAAGVLVGAWTPQVHERLLSGEPGGPKHTGFALLGQLHLELWTGIGLAGGMLASLAGLLEGKRRGKLGSSVLALAILGLTGTDLAWQGFGVLRTARDEAIFPPHALAQTLGNGLAAYSGPQPRVLDLAGALPDAVAVRAGIPMLGGMNPLPLARAYAFSRFLQGEPPEIPRDRTVYGLMTFQVTHPRLLAWLRVDEVVSAEPLSLPGYALQACLGGITVFQQFRGLATYPRLYVYRARQPGAVAWLVARARKAPEGLEATFRAQEGLEVTQEVLLEGAGLDGRPEERQAGDSGVAQGGSVVTESWRPEEQVFRVEVRARRAWLVVSELQAPGWKVWVDGEEKPGLTAAGLLRAVEVGTGRHRVVWAFGGAGGP